MPKERNVIKTGISINCSEGFKLELKNVNTINSQMGLIILETTLSGESEEEILIWIFNSSNSPKMIVDGDLLANIVCNRVILPKIGIQGSENLPPDFKRKNNKMDKLELDTGIREQVTDTCPILVIKLDDVSLAAFLDGGCSKNIIDYSLVQSLGWSDRITENNTRFGVVGGTTSNAIGIIPNMKINTGAVEIIQENELDSDETKTLNVDKNLKIQNVEELLENLPGIVCKSFKDLRGTLTTKHKIILKDKNAKPIKHKVSRVPIALNNWLKEELENLERSGIISKTDSPWSFRVVLVPKPNGKTRMCIDFRDLNELTIYNTQPQKPRCLG